MAAEDLMMSHADSAGAGSARALRVMIVDDNPVDRAALRAELLRAYPASRITEVGQPADLHAALQSPFDLVITDYQFGWGSGMEVLRQVKRRDEFTPVIMFTATGGQEEAVAAMREGLDDYVVKTPRHLVRLRGTIHSVLEHAHARRRAAELQIRLQNLLEQLQVGVFRVTVYGRLLECNRSMQRLIGVTSLEEVADSPQLREMLWERGEAGPLDLLRQSGDEVHREITMLREGKPRRYSVRMVYSEIDGQIVVDGLVEELKLPN